MVSQRVLTEYPDIEFCIPFSPSMSYATATEAELNFETFCSHAEDGRLVCFCDDDADQPSKSVHTPPGVAAEGKYYLRLWPGDGKPSTHTLSVSVANWLVILSGGSIDEQLARLALSAMDVDLDSDGDSELVIRLFADNRHAYALGDSYYQTYVLPDSSLNRVLGQAKPPLYWYDTIARLPSVDLGLWHELDERNDASLGLHGNPDGGCSLVHVEYGFELDTAAGPFYRRETGFPYEDGSVRRDQAATWTLYFVDPTVIEEFRKTGDRDALRDAVEAESRVGDLSGLTMRTPKENQP